MTPLESCIAALRTGPTEAIFKAIEKGTGDTVGHKLFTLLYVAPNAKRVKRLYTNMPKEYPVGGYKELILSLGCESAMNVPVLYNGHLLGTMNLLDAAGRYKETHPKLCEAFAALLVGPFLDAIAADPDIGS